MQRRPLPTEATIAVLPSTSRLLPRAPVRTGESMGAPLFSTCSVHTGCIRAPHTPLPSVTTHQSRKSHTARCFAGTCRTCRDPRPC